MMFKLELKFLQVAFLDEYAGSATAPAKCDFPGIRKQAPECYRVHPHDRRRLCYRQEFHGLRLRFDDLLGGQLPNAALIFQGQVKLLVWFHHRGLGGPGTYGQHYPVTGTMSLQSKSLSVYRRHYLPSFLSHSNLLYWTCQAFVSNYFYFFLTGGPSSG